MIYFTLFIWNMQTANFADKFCMKKQFISCFVYDNILEDYSIKNQIKNK